MLKYPCSNGDCAPYEVTLDKGVYNIELVGASGGYDGTSLGAKGAYVSGILTLLHRSKFYFFIGEAGQFNGPPTYNGGGKGSLGPGNKGGSGGGATDMRVNNAEWNDTLGLRSRVMVAGGGAGDNYWNQRIYGGCGGFIGRDGSIYSTLEYQYISIATGGKQTEGGVGSKSSVTFVGSSGKFGIGGQTLHTHGSAGGGGYYGGGGGSSVNDRVTSGGGGSSFVSGYEDCDAVDEKGVHTGQSKHYSKIIFQKPVITDCFDSSKYGITDGYGFAIISVISPLIIQTCRMARNSFNILLIVLFVISSD